MKTSNVLLLLISFSLLFTFGCSEENISLNNSENNSDLISDILYTSKWGTDFNKISLLYQTTSNEYYFPASEKSFFRISAQGDLIEENTDCSIMTISGKFIICKNKIFSPENGFSKKGNFEKITGVTLGSNDRLLYLYDTEGNLYITDTHANSRPNDDIPLILWKEYGFKLKILSGNGLTELKNMILPGRIVDVKIFSDFINILYLNEKQNKWGIIKINVKTFKTTQHIYFEITNSGFPIEFAVSSDKIAIIFDNQMSYLLLNTETLDITAEKLKIVPDYVVYSDSLNKFVFVDTDTVSLKTFEN